MSASDEKIAVEITFRARGECRVHVEMTRAEYADWCDRIDEAGWSEREDLAEELAAEVGADLSRDTELTDLEVEDFCEIKPRNSEAA